MLHGKENKTKVNKGQPAKTNSPDENGAATRKLISSQQQSCLSAVPLLAAPSPAQRYRSASDSAAAPFQRNPGALASAHTMHAHSVKSVSLGWAGLVCSGRQEWKKSRKYLRVFFK